MTDGILATPKLLNRNANSAKVNYGHQSLIESVGLMKEKLKYRFSFWRFNLKTTYFQ